MNFLRTTLLLGVLMAGLARAEDPPGGGEGCLPGGYAPPLITGPNALLSIVVLPYSTPAPEGANCTGARARAAGANNQVISAGPDDHSIRWSINTQTTPMRKRTLYIKADPAALGAPGFARGLEMEIYRQSLTRSIATGTNSQMELRVLMKRTPSGSTATSPTEVWVIVQDGSQQLAFLSVPLRNAFPPECSVAGMDYHACVTIEPSATTMNLDLVTGADSRTAKVPNGLAHTIRLGNIQTSAGRAVDIFTLAHSFADLP